jgi:hypothetical protein
LRIESTRPPKVRDVLTAAVEKLLGPKTEADLAPPPEKKKVKVKVGGRGWRACYCLLALLLRLVLCIIQA